MDRAALQLLLFPVRSYDTFPILQPDLFDRPLDQLRTPAKGSAPSSPAPRRTKQVRHAGEDDVTGSEVGQLTLSACVCSGNQAGAEEGPEVLDGAGHVVQVPAGSLLRPVVHLLTHVC